MSAFAMGNQLWGALRAPLVALAYAAVAFLVVHVGCMPPFSDADFFGVPVTFFLIFVLTATALILIVFATLGAWRTLRVLRRQRRRESGRWRALALAAVILALAAFAATAAGGFHFLRTLCA